MSITLRDAQYLSWKTFKKLERMPQGSSVSASATDLISKAQEIVKKIQDSNNSADSADLGHLFSELLFIIFVLAEQHKVSLEESFLATVDDIILGSAS